jgi:hypothetical protein
MKTLSGTFPFKLVILAAIAAVSIVLISAFGQPGGPGKNGKPILIIMKEPGVKVTRSSEDVEKEFTELIKNHGESVCNVDYYDKDQVKKWHQGNRKLTMISAVRSEAGGDPAPVDPIHLVQQIAFDKLGDATDFLTTIK